MKKKLSHLDSKGAARMVDVGSKPVSRREAMAEGFVKMAAATLKAISSGALPKGDVFAVARVAGIVAAKKCGELIPLCHPLPIESVEVKFDVPTIAGGKAVALRIEAVARITARTGVEMEALTAVSVAALAIYDMCKAIDKGMAIDGVRLISKTKTAI